MLTFLIVLHIVLALLIIGIILIQKSSSDGLEGLGGAGSPESLISSRAAASFLTKLTVVLVALFMMNCLLLANFHLRSTSVSLISKTSNEVANKSEAAAPIAK